VGDVVADEGAAGALLKPLKLTINDPSFPLSMYLKNERGEIVHSPTANKDLYRVAQQISSQIRFLPVEGVSLKVEYHDRGKLKDYPALLDCVLKVLYRACIIECMSSNSVEDIEIKQVRSDRRKIVVNITPTRTQVPDTDLKQAEGNSPL
jgi:hypothetical protein